MEAVIRYRHYRWDELHGFLDNKAFYSRSSRFRGNCPGRPDVLRTEYEIKPGVPGKTGSIRVMLDLNEARIISRGSQRGQPPAGYEMRIKDNMQTVYVLAKVLEFMDKIVTDLPLLLYATAHARQVRDYTAFMLSDTPRLLYDELAELVRDRRAREAHVSAGPYHIVQLPEGEWASWIEGDELIPVFSDEWQVLRFITQRVMPYETVGAVFGKMPDLKNRKTVELEMPGGYAASPPP